jgi:hypothetical protein
VSVGHVARLLEEGGISTVLIAVRAFRARLEMMTLPRVVLTPHLMGRPVGPPGEGRKQAETLRAALDLLGKAQKAGTVLDLSSL